MKLSRTILAAAAVSIAAVPAAAPADPGEVILNPFGNLSMQIVDEPEGATPGLARLRIHTANGQVTADGTRVYFGLRIMAPEGSQMTGFALTGGDGCIVSDFAGAGTEGGWQLGDVFGTAAPELGSLNAHMRMVGGFLQKSCGDLTIDLAFNTRPFVAFYGAFFGEEPAPWHDNYDEAPWDTIPTGGDTTYENWWDLWGTFDTLGYSNACTNVSGAEVSCG